METQTRFDLNAAIESWRQELAEQPELSPQVRRELETHLCDTIAELQRRGLNDEESFWLARRRVGQPKEICGEFAKVDPAKIWRERFFWMALGIMVFWQLTLLVTYAEGIAFSQLTPGFRAFYESNWGLFAGVPVLLVGILLARSKQGQSARKIWFLKNRVRLTAIVIILPILCGLMQCENIHQENLEAGRQFVVTWAAWFHSVGQQSLVYLKSSIAPLILLVWFFPKQNREKSKHA